MSEATRPDAVMIPGSWAYGDHEFSRLHSILDHARRVLGVKRSGGEKAYARPMPGPRSEFYCTRDPQDTILFPTSHPLSGHPRYEWEDLPDGSRVGRLVATAKPGEATALNA